MKVTWRTYNRETDGPFFGGKGVIIPFGPKATAAPTQPQDEQETSGVQSQQMSEFLKQQAQEVREQFGASPSEEEE